MKKFGEIKEGDKLYIVYKDLNKDYCIGEGVVTGFHDWTYEIGDRWETWGTKAMTNIEYEFRGIEFSRNMEYEYEKTHFTDSPEFHCDYGKVMGDNFVETFTSYNEAKAYILARLLLFIGNTKEQIEKLEAEIGKYKDNLKQFE